MAEETHRPGGRQGTARAAAGSHGNLMGGSLLLFLAACLAVLPEAPAQAAGLKDCIPMESGTPAIVHEGRYNILCVRPSPGPFSLACQVDGVPGESQLMVTPENVAGPGAARKSVSTDGPLLRLDGNAGAEAHVFFSYDGPFAPIRDGYALTCRW